MVKLQKCDNVKKYILKGPTKIINKQSKPRNVKTVKTQKNHGKNTKCLDGQKENFHKQ